MSYKVYFILNNKKIEANADEGLSFLEIAHNNDIPLVGNCGGAMACGTCIVELSDEWIEILKATEEEEDVLDVVFGVTKNTQYRNSCQLKIRGKFKDIFIHFFICQGIFRIRSLEKIHFRLYTN